MNAQEKKQLIGVSIALAAAITITGCSESSATPSTLANYSDTLRLANSSESAKVKTNNLDESMEAGSMTWAECGDPNRPLPTAQEGQYNVNLVFAVVDEGCEPLSSTFDIELHAFDLFAADYTSSSTMINKWLDVGLNNENTVDLQFSQNDFSKMQSQSGSEDSIGYFFDVTFNTEQDAQKLCIIDFNTANSAADKEAMYVVFLSKSTTGSCTTQPYTPHYIEPQESDLITIDPNESDLIHIESVNDQETGECLSEYEGGPCVNTNTIEPQESDLITIDPNETSDIEVCTLNSANEVVCSTVTFDFVDTATDNTLQSCFGPGYLEALEAGEDTTPYILSSEECH